MFFDTLLYRYNLFMDRYYLLQRYCFDTSLNFLCRAKTYPNIVKKMVKKSIACSGWYLFILVQIFSFKILVDTLTPSWAVQNIPKYGINVKIVESMLKDHFMILDDTFLLVQIFTIKILSQASLIHPRMEPKHTQIWSKMSKSLQRAQNHS